jgi:hypothetical protein
VKNTAFAQQIDSAQHNMLEFRDLNRVHRAGIEPATQ